MQYERKNIYDILLRLSHAMMALSCLVLMLTAWGAQFFFEEGLYRKSLWITHIFSGYLLIIFFSIRVLWGFVGPKHARWSELIKIKEWL